MFVHWDFETGAGEVDVAAANAELVERVVAQPVGRVVAQLVGRVVAQLVTLEVFGGVGGAGNE